MMHAFVFFLKTKKCRYVEEDYFAELLALDDIALEGVLMMLLDKDDGDTAEYVAPPCKYFISGKCFRYECWYVAR